MAVYVLPAASAGMLLDEFHQPLSHGYFPGQGVRGSLFIAGRQMNV